MLSLHFNVTTKVLDLIFICEFKKKQHIQNGTRIQIRWQRKMLNVCYWRGGWLPVLHTQVPFYTYSQIQTGCFYAMALNSRKDLKAVWIKPTILNMLCADSWMGRPSTRSGALQVSMPPISTLASASVLQDGGSTPSQGTHTTLR